MNLFFISRNRYKIAEVQKLFSRSNIAIIPIQESIDELQTQNVDALVKDKYIAPIKKHDKLREELKGESDGS